MILNKDDDIEASHMWYCNGNTCHTTGICNSVISLVQCIFKIEFKSIVNFAPDHNKFPKISHNIITDMYFPS